MSEEKTTTVDVDTFSAEDLALFRKLDAKRKEAAKADSGVKKSVFAKIFDGKVSAQDILDIRDRSGKDSVGFGGQVPGTTISFSVNFRETDK